MVIPSHEVGHVFIEGIIKNRFADTVTNANDKAFIMDAGKCLAGNFVDFIEMMQISGSIVLA